MSTYLDNLFSFLIKKEKVSPDGGKKHPLVIPSVFLG
jgi:hypothetical protein